MADKAAVSRRIEELQTLGLIVPFSKKQYKLLYSLTEEGEKIGKTLCARIDAVLDAVSDGLTDAERAIFYAQLSKISDNLQNVAESI